MVEQSFSDCSAAARVGPARLGELQAPNPASARLALLPLMLLYTGLLSKAVVWIKCTHEIKTKTLKTTTKEYFYGFRKMLTIQ